MNYILYNISNTTTPANLFNCTLLLKNMTVE